MIKIILLILAGDILAMGGQIFFKKSINNMEKPHLKTLESYLDFLKKLLGLPVIWAGFGLVAVGVVFWLTALAQTDLSIAFPLDSMQYIVTLLFARIFLGEKIDRMKFTGTFLIIAGIILVSMT